MNPFRPKAAVIAGVGPGSGAAIARKLAKEGCAVGLIARSQDYLDQLARELSATKTPVASAQADVSDANQVKRAFARLRDALGPIDLLVFHASAGGPFGQGLLAIDPEDFARSWAVGTLGGMLCAQAVVPEMLQRGAGAILSRGQLLLYVVPLFHSVVLNLRCAGSLKALPASFGRKESMLLTS
jgi:NAD(P)-dependent dehydrogenase (short-subunit alcohol dehydrogenase family)